MKTLYNPQNKLTAAEVDKKLKTRIVLNFSARPTKYINIFISEDFSQIVFTDQGQNFVVENKDGCQVQKKIVQLDGKMSYVVHQCSDGDKGFYFICSASYDKSIKIIHNLREKKIMKIFRNIEPDIFKVFDFKIAKK